MAVSKVVYGNTTLIDLTEDSVDSGSLLEGKTAHDAGGNAINGSIPENSTITSLISNKEDVVEIPAGYYAEGGSVGISQDEQDKITPATVPPGMTILGVTGKAPVTQPYLYYRVLITNLRRAKATSSSEIKEFNIFQNMANVRMFQVLDGGVASDIKYNNKEACTANSNHPNNPADYAFNDNLTNMWETDWRKETGYDSTTGWAKLQLKEAKGLSFVMIARRPTGNQLDYIKQGEVQGSNDDENWDTLITINESDDSVWLDNQEKILYIDDAANINI